MVPYLPGGLDATGPEMSVSPAGRSEGWQLLGRNGRSSEPQVPFPSGMAGAQGLCNKMPDLTRDVGKSFSTKLQIALFNNIASTIWQWKLGVLELAVKPLSQHTMHLGATEC